MKTGRKFTALIIASVLIALGMASGIVGAIYGRDMPWLAGLLPVLASTYPAYLGANAAQKNAELKRKSHEIKDI